MSTDTQRVWTIAEAKARLSEILRLASEKGPQRIGTQTPYVVVPEEVWNKLVNPRPPLGRWVLENMRVGVELDLPSRSEPDRQVKFDDEQLS